MTYDNPDKIIEELFDSLLSRYQIFRNSNDSK